MMSALRLSVAARPVLWALVLLSGACLSSGRDAVGAVDAGSAGAVEPGPLSWSPPIRIDDDAAFGALAPEIAMDPSGNIMAVWLQNAPGRDISSRVLARLFTADGWQAPVALTSDADADLPAYQTKIAADGHGHFFAVWSQAWNTDDATPIGVYGRRYLSGGEWQPLTTLYAADSGASATGALDIAADDLGNATVVWAGNDALWAHFAIHSARYAWDTGWLPDQILSTDGVQSATPPAVAMDAEGNAIAVWGQAAGDSQAHKGAQACRYTDGSGWETPTPIEPALTAETRSSALSRVGFDPNGNAIAVWSHSAQPGIYATRWSDATGWGTTAAIADPSSSGADEGVRLVIDEQGDAVALWSHQGGGLLASRYTAGGTWAAAQLVDAGYCDSGNIAVGPDGMLVAVWVRRAEDSNVIVANRSRSGTRWGAAGISIVTQGKDAGDPRIVVDSAGTATVVWRQEARVYAARASAL
jgi:hypothetical protein